MKELSPNNIIDAVYFSLSSQECLDTSDNAEQVSLTHGEIFNSSKCACLVNSSTLEVVCLESGRRKAAWNFYSSNTKESIVCFCSCHNKLIIALKCTNSYPIGKLCIFDPGTSKIIKTINLNYIPTCVAVIKEFGGAGYNSSSLSDYLKCMFGIVAVGTEDGHILLIDLRLDDFENDSAAVLFSSLQILDPSEDIDTARIREKARTMERHCAFDLSYSMCSYTAFTYVNVNGQIRKVFPKSSSYVSSVKYQSNISSLIVGFSFGCFQIWSLEYLQLLHSSPVSAFNSPVTHFIFQEPDDDPRHCCYLWVGRGPTSTQTQISLPASLALYQMSYEFKENSKDVGHLYKNLECVIKRFSHQLTSDVHHLVDSRSVGSRIIAFNNLYGESDSSLCYVVWECPSSNGGVSSHMGIFDINRWYQKQLPPSIREAMYGRMEAVCPFFVFYSLTDIVEGFLPSALLDVTINKGTLSNFRAVSGPQNDQYYWPSASTLIISCLFETAVVKSELLGIQRQIVAEMRKTGTDTFQDSQNLVQSCLLAGLLPSLDVLKHSCEKKNTDAILTVNFENNGVGFIINCIKKWVHGSISHGGHSVRLIFEWAWSHIVQKKKALDQLHISLFSSLTDIIEAAQLKQLKSISSDLNSLMRIIKAIRSSDFLTDEIGLEEIEDKLNITEHMTKYSKLLLLLVEMELLPECSQTYFQTQAKERKYPVPLMTSFYQTHKEERRNTKKPCLVIDVLLDEVLESMEESNDHSKTLSLECYPPTSVEELCDIYLQVVDEDNLHSKLVYYWVLDVCECYQTLKEKHIAEKCVHSLELSQEESLFVKSLWLLDHSFSEEGIEHILKMKTKFPSNYFNLIIKTLYTNKMFEQLSHLCSTMIPQLNFTVDEMKFVIRVYLELKLMFNAYRLQTAYNTEQQNEHQKEVFEHFLQHCKDNGLLGKLLSLSLMPEEEEILRAYLESTPSNGEFLLVYLLERGFYLEAYQLLKRLENIAAVALDEVAQDSAITRRLLVDGFIKTIPRIQQHILIWSNENQQKPRGFTSPLSTVLKQGENFVSPQTFIAAAMQANMCNNLDTSKIGNLFSNPRRRKSQSLLEEVMMSHPKKLKEMPTTPAFSKTSRRRKSLQATSDAYLLLRTPRLVKDSLVSHTIEINMKTPQSILKSKASVSKFGSVAIKSTGAAKKQSLVKEEFTPSRKIRFVGLSPTSPEFSSPAFQRKPTVTEEKQSPIAQILDELIGPSEKTEFKIQKSSPSLMSPEQIFEALSRRDDTFNSSAVDETSLYDDSVMFYSPPQDTSFDEVKIKNQKAINESSVQAEATDLESSSMEVDQQVPAQLEEADKEELQAEHCTSVHNEIPDISSPSETQADKMFEAKDDSVTEKECEHADKILVHSGSNLKADVVSEEYEMHCTETDFIKQDKVEENVTASDFKDNFIEEGDICYTEPTVDSTRQDSSAVAQESFKNQESPKCQETFSDSQLSLAQPEEQDLGKSAKPTIVILYDSEDEGEAVDENEAEHSNEDHEDSDEIEYQKSNCYNTSDESESESSYDSEEEDEEEDIAQEEISSESDGDREEHPLIEEGQSFGKEDNEFIKNVPQNYKESVCSKVISTKDSESNIGQINVDREGLSDDNLYIKAESEVVEPDEDHTAEAQTRVDKPSITNNDIILLEDEYHEEYDETDKDILVSDVITEDEVQTDIGMTVAERGMEVIPDDDGEDDIYGDLFPTNLEKEEEEVEGYGEDEDHDSVHSDDMATEPMLNVDPVNLVDEITESESEIDVKNVIKELQVDRQLKIQPEENKQHIEIQSEESDQRSEIPSGEKEENIEILPQQNEQHMRSPLQQSEQKMEIHSQESEQHIEKELKENETLLQKCEQYSLEVVTNNENMDMGRKMEFDTLTEQNFTHNLADVTTAIGCQKTNEQNNSIQQSESSVVSMESNYMETNITSPSEDNTINISSDTTQESKKMSYIEISDTSIASSNLQTVVEETNSTGATMKMSLDIAHPIEESIVDLVSTTDDENVHKSKSENEHDKNQFPEDKPKSRRRGRAKKTTDVKLKTDLVREQLNSVNVNLIKEPEKTFLRSTKNETNNVSRRRSTRGKSLSPEKNNSVTEKLNHSNKNLRETAELVSPQQLDNVERRRSARILTSSSSKYAEVLAAVTSPIRSVGHVKDTTRQLFVEPLQMVSVNPADVRMKHEEAHDENFTTSPARNTRLPTQNTTSPFHNTTSPARNTRSRKNKTPPDITEATQTEEKQPLQSTSRNRRPHNRSTRTLMEEEDVPSTKERVDGKVHEQKSSLELAASPSRNTRSRKSATFTSVDDKLSVNETVNEKKLIKATETEVEEVMDIDKKNRRNKKMNKAPTSRNVELGAPPSVVITRSKTKKHTLVNPSQSDQSIEIGVENDLVEVTATSSRKTRATTNIKIQEQFNELIDERIDQNEVATRSRRRHTLDIVQNRPKNTTVKKSIAEEFGSPSTKLSEDVDERSSTTVRSSKRESSRRATLALTNITTSPARRSARLKNK